MVFSESIESIQMLKKMLQNRRIKSMQQIEIKREKIVSEWGKAFFPLLSVYVRDMI
ncbi:MAG: hypothetical protein WAM14_05515 [Candidatus Nitrosopolaris sp.]